MIGAGSYVEFAVMPAWVTELPEESQRVFRFCLGPIYRVAEIDRNGIMVLGCLGVVAIVALAVVGWLFLKRSAPLR
jgi:hypothetical protein